MEHIDCSLQTLGYRSVRAQSDLTCEQGWPVQMGVNYCKQQWMWMMELCLWTNISLEFGTLEAFWSLLRICAMFPTMIPESERPRVKFTTSESRVQCPNHYNTMHCERRFYSVICKPMSEGAAKRWEFFLSHCCYITMRWIYTVPKICPRFNLFE